MSKMRESVAQLRLTDNGGMSYAVRLADGSFILIDGGEADKCDSGSYDDNSRVLLGYLKRHSEGKIKIACWLFTHFHYDHIDLATRFLREMRNEIEVSRFAYNHPGHEETLRDKEREDELFAAMDLYEGAERKILKTHDRLMIGDTRIDVYIAEDTRTSDGLDQNEISAAFKITLGSGRSFTVLGDCSTKRMCAFVSDDSGVKVPDEELKCDVLQVAHHGLTMSGEPYRSGARELYRVMSPTYALYPIAKVRFDDRPHFKSEAFPDNRYLIENCKGCYHHSQTTVIYMDTLEVIIEDI